MIALASCLRNEGIFVLEGLSHRRASDFDRGIVVKTEITGGVPQPSCPEVPGQDRDGGAR